MKDDWGAVLVSERVNLLRTLETLSDDQFSMGSTLCDLWSPRDILAHVVALDHTLKYVGWRSWTVNTINARMVEASRRMSRGELVEAGWRATEQVSSAVLPFARVLAGDVVMHHFDVLWPLGQQPQLSDLAARAMMSEATLWSWRFGAKIARYRICPTDHGMKPRGRGRVVRGPTAALALWMAGRRGIEPKLAFESS